MENENFLLKKYGIVDAHCDSILDVLHRKRRLGVLSEEAQADFPRLIDAGVKLQFFAVFIETEFKPHKAVMRALEGIEAFYKEVKQSNEQVILIDTKDKIKKLREEEYKIGAVLAIEGGEALGGQLSMLSTLYRLGVRSIGLTWNQRNEIADGVGVGENHQGLTEFGRNVIDEMNRLGMLIDLSHIAEKGFWDVLEHSKKSVIVTHANCQSLCNHPRNLNDKQLKALAMQDGCIGITFVPGFVDTNKPTLEKVVEHIKYATQKMGVDHVGLGSDFDGMDSSTPGLEDVSKYPNLIEGLAKKGFTENEIEKIIGGNWLRIIKEQFKN